MVVKPTPGGACNATGFDLQATHLDFNFLRQQDVVGIQISKLISESEVGRMTPFTSQRSGKSSAGQGPLGSLKDPAGTRMLSVMVD